jgi:hypothetical protein
MLSLQVGKEKADLGDDKRQKESSCPAANCLCPGFCFLFVALLGIEPRAF